MSHTIPGFSRRAAAPLSAALIALLATGCSSIDGGDGRLAAEADARDARLEGGAIGIPAGQPGFSDGVVSVAHPLAAMAGAATLREGGNAIDAAAVVQFVLNVVEPTSSGIGGGGFMGVHLADRGRTFFIDSREKAPAAASATQFLACDPACPEVLDDEGRVGSDINPEVGFTDIATSGIGVGVPGTLLGVAHALERYGTLTLAEAMSPAITLARDGFVINQRLATLTDNVRTGVWPETSARFRTPDGAPLPEGFVLVQPELARTFELIAEQGVDAFYSGPMAQAIVAAQRQTRDTVGAGGRGRMSVRDLADYRAAGVDEREPVTFHYRGFTLHGMPSPSSGGYTVAQVLHCLEDFALGDAAAGFGVNSANTLHVMVEAMRLAFSSRSVWMGDTDAVDLPITGLLSDGYLDERCGLIRTDSRIADELIVPGDPRRFDPAFSDGGTIASAADAPSGIDTTHFTIIDADGNVVSWTSTIEGTWGSGITVPGYGFLLNNELTDFNFTPQRNDDVSAFAPGANDVAPGKRPRSSMAPTLVFAGDDFRAAYGSPGGSTIINSVINITVNLIDHGLSVQQAVDAPRISATSPSGAISYEDGLDPDALQALQALGHTLRDAPGEIGSVQAVIVDPVTKRRYGAADDRRAGTVVGL